MRKTLNFLVFNLIGVCLLFFLLEGFFFVLGFPKGASDFIERANFQQKLCYQKPVGQFRIFAYGESTMLGAGYWPTSSPAKWLEAYLRDFLPGRNFKVMNYVRLGEGSDFILQAFRDTLQYKPDLAIFYLGHNTFFPVNRVATVRKRESNFISILRQWFHKSRLVSFVVRETIRHKLKRHSHWREDQMGVSGIEADTYRFDAEPNWITVPGSPVYQENLEFFKNNLNQIVRLGKQYHVPIIFLKPVGNLKDYAPNFSGHLKSLSDEEKRLWEQWYAEGQECLKKKDYVRTADFFEKAYAIDSTYAKLSFRLGQLYFQKGDIEKAKVFFEEARDNDWIVRRAPKGILSIFEHLVQKEGIHYLDTEKVFLAHVPGGILGWPIIEDNVHFSVEGQALVARSLAEFIANNPWIAPRFEWQFDHERSFDEISKEFGISNETVFRNYCSVISYLGHRYEDRILFAQRAQSLFPDHPTALRHLAWAYWLNGQKTRAIEIYKYLGEKDPATLQTVFRVRPEIRQAFGSFSSKSVQSK